MKSYIFRLLYLLRLLNPASRTFFRAFVEDRDDFEKTLNNLRSETQRLIRQESRNRAFRHYLIGRNTHGFNRIHEKEEIPGAADMFIRQQPLTQFRLSDVQTVHTDYGNDEFNQGNV